MIRFMAVVCLAVVFGCGIFVGRTDTIQEQKQKIPTITELQLMVGAEPDGIIGKETLRLWETALCNQYAEPFMKGTK